MAPGKTARREKVTQKKTYGVKVMLINMSEEPRYCAGTGALLPKKGMVVLYEDNYYKDWTASERAANVGGRS